MTHEKTTNTCPYCKEDILDGAIKCKHCGSNLATTNPPHDGICPYCKENIHKEAIKCKHCQSIFSADAESDCMCEPKISAFESARLGEFSSPTFNPGFEAEPESLTQNIGVKRKEICFPYWWRVCTGTPGNLNCRWVKGEICINFPVPELNQRMSF